MIKELKGVKVEFYTDLKTIPIYKLNEFQAQLSQDSGMGSTIFDINKRFERLDAFLAQGKTIEALHERRNQTYGIFLMLDKINTRSLCLAHLVKTISNEYYPDQTDEDIQLIARRLELLGLSMQDVDIIIDDVKKKLMLILGYTSQN